MKTTFRLQCAITKTTNTITSSCGIIYSKRYTQMMKAKKNKLIFRIGHSIFCPAYIITLSSSFGTRKVVRTEIRQGVIRCKHKYSLKPSVNRNKGKFTQFIEEVVWLAMVVV
jgi:hypothetical protein